VFLIATKKNEEKKKDEKKKLKLSNVMYASVT